MLRRKSLRRFPLYIILFMMMVFIQTCSGMSAYINADNYSPVFKSPLTNYSGKPVCLAYVINEAPNTSIWYYNSKYYSRTWYWAAPKVATFFQESFKRSFIYLGMNVYDEYEQVCPPEVPTMEVSLLSISDEEFQIRVTLLGKGISFSNIYTVTGTPPEKKEKTYLEQRAYNMVNEMVETILSDNAFAKAFLLRNEKDAQRIKECEKNIYFIDEKKIKKPYNVIDIISDTKNNDETNYAFAYIKQRACEEGADALITPIVDTGPFRTTVRSKAIVFITSTTDSPRSKQSIGNSGVNEMKKINKR